MRIARRLQTFQDTYPLVGPSLWLLSVQYFLIQIMVAAVWTRPYSWSLNTISDLGNSVCGLYGDRYVCSPQHNFMNASFVVLGITMFFGAILLYREFHKSLWSAIGFSGMALAGLGTLLVGLFPENTNNTLHTLGAALPFLIGNLSIGLLGVVLDIPQWLRIYSIATSVLTLIALVLFTSHTYLGLGIGGMERLVGYPQTVWLIVFGLYTSRNHYHQNSSAGRR
jgi:hypothetical membrane protein